jgi:hypothetical protein
MTEQEIPAFPSQCQKGVPRRMPRILGLPSGMVYLPIFRVRLGGRISAEERNGR